MCFNLFNLCISSSQNNKTKKSIKKPATLKTSASPIEPIISPVETIVTFDLDKNKLDIIKQSDLSSANNNNNTSRTKKSKFLKKSHTFLNTSSENLNFKFKLFDSKAKYLSLDLDKQQEYLGSHNITNNLVEQTNIINEQSFISSLNKAALTSSPSPGSSLKFADEENSFKNLDADAFKPTSSTTANTTSGAKEIFNRNYLKRFLLLSQINPTYSSASYDKNVLINKNLNNLANSSEISSVSISSYSSSSSMSSLNNNNNNNNKTFEMQEDNDVEMGTPDSFNNNNPFSAGGQNLFAASNKRPFNTTNTNSKPTENFEFAMPKLNRPPLFNAGFMNRPNYTLTASNNNYTSKLQKTSQPELKLDQLQTKKQQFFFKSDQIFAKPNDLIRDDDLSNVLNEELNNSNYDMNNHPHSHTHSSHSHPHHHHHHHHHHKHKSRGGKLTISPEQVYEFKESDLKDLGQIGNGEFGTVHRVLHQPSQTYMALKRIGPTVGNQGERKKVLKELDFVLECHENPYVVKFYGVKFNNEPADCLICMELMDTSLEKFYKFVYEKKREEIPEEILGKICVATVNALNYLKEEYKIIHRDVKPSNILVNRQGQIKMCDFGISGKLVDSIAASRDAGCQLYMAPERIDPARAYADGGCYDVRSDVWSLGITLYELATGKFPYPQWKTIFHQLNLVVDSDAPRLEAERLSKDFKDFVNTCLTKDDKKRPKYKVLLQHPLIRFHSNNNIDMSRYFEPYISEMPSCNFNVVR